MNKKLMSHLMLLIILCVSFSSCSEEEDSGEQNINSKVELLKSHKWFARFHDLDTWGDNNVSFNRTNVWLYFVSDTKGFFYYGNYNVDSELGTSNNEWTEEFTYEISGNRVQIYPSDCGTMEPMTLSKTNLGEFQAQELYTSDYALIVNIMGDKSDLGKEYYSSISNNVKVSFNKETHIINVKSNLTPIYPNKKIEYLIEYECYQYNGKNPFYSDSDTYKYKGDSNSGENFLCGKNCAWPDDILDIDICTTTIKNIEERYEKGEAFYESEFELYNISEKKRREIIKKYNKISVTLYIIIDGIKIQIAEVNDNIGDEGAAKYSVVNCSTCYGTGRNGLYDCSACYGSKYQFKSTDANNTTGNSNSPTTSSTENGHEYVDLGLSVKWATMNIGATSSSDFGYYYAWGETKPKEVYDWSTYRWCYGTQFSTTKYSEISDGMISLTSTDDAAKVNWGGTWRMPTSKEISDLIEKCNWTWTTQNRVKGYKVVSKTNGKSIFLPAAGIYKNGTCEYVGEEGIYWSNTLVPNHDDDGAYVIEFWSSNHRQHSIYRCQGLTVRAVCP